MRTKRMNRRLCFWNFTSLIASWQRLTSGTHSIRQPERLQRSLFRLSPHFPYRRSLLALSLLLPTTALAGPTGEQVTAGSATVSRPDAVTTLITQQSQKAVIDWRNFSIAQQEMVRFQQPGTDSVALNRVLGNDPSRIYGNLSANGQVFLVNPSGVLFAPGAQVSVQGLLATTHDISNTDFMAGRYSFSRTENGLPDAQVMNQGHLTANDGGYIVLAGDYAANSGVIQARLGQVALASGNRFILDLKGDQLIGLAVDEASLAKRAGVENLGQISADGGQVVMTARVANDLATTVVNNAGLVQARSIEERNGTIILHGSTSGIVANSGTLDASGKDIGETGGSVRVLGEKVGLFGHAVVDVSGQTGGGTALIGGEYQGRNPAIQNAQATYIGQDAVIKTDAIENGDGGRAIVWADDVTRAYGNISARGGRYGGDGGFVEVSGKKHLDFRTQVDTQAPQGKIGTLLLDPYDIEVVATGGSTTLTNFDAFADLPTTGVSKVDAATIAGNGTDVLLQATHDITFTDPLSFSTNTVGLTAQAGNDITVAAGGSITTKGGAISLTANDNGATTATGIGKITINAALDTTNTVPAGANITLTTPGSNPGTPAITLNANLKAGTAGNIYLTAASAAQGISQTSGTITAGSLKVISDGSVSLPTLNQVTTIAANLTGAGASFGYESADGFSIGSVGGTLGVTTNNGNITIRGYGTTPIQIAEGVTAGTGDILLGQANVGGGGDIDVAAAKTVGGNNVQLYASDVNGLLTINGTVSGAGSVLLNTPGTITIPNAGVVSGPSLNLTADSMDLQAGSSINAGAGLAWLKPYTSGQNIDLGGVDAVGTLGLDTNELNQVTAGTLRVGALTAGNLATTAAIAPSGTSTLSLESGGTVTQAGAGTITETNLVIRALGDVTLDTASNLVTNLAASIGNGSNQNKNFKFKNSPALNIGSNIDSTSGISIVRDANNFDSANPNGVVSLISANALTQSPTALLGGKAVYAEGTKVALTEANPTGVIAGKATGAATGDTFAYTSANGVHLSTVNSFQGVQHTNSGLADTYAVFLTGPSISQDTGLTTGAPVSTPTGKGLQLTTTGPISLSDGNNSVSLLNITGTLTGPLTFKDKTNLDFKGVMTSNQPVRLEMVGAGLTVTGAIAAGSGSIDLGGNSVTTSANISGSKVMLWTPAAGSISVDSGTISGSTAVGIETDALTLTGIISSPTGEIYTGEIYIHPATNNRPITIGRATCQVGPCLLIPDASTSKLDSLKLAIGSDTIGVVTDPVYPFPISGDIYLGGALDRTTSGWLGLFTGGKITQDTNAPITALNLGISAVTGPVNLGGDITDHNVTNVAAKTGGVFSLNVAGPLTVTSLSGGDPVITVNGITAPGGVTLRATNDLTLAQPINAGTGQVSLYSGNGAIVDGNGIGVNNVTASTLDISAYGNIDLDAQVSSVNATSSFGTVTVRPYPPPSSSPPPPPPPTVDACTADPTLSGCSTVLPTLDTCIANPTAPGCSAVLPPLADCTTNPALPGCTAVLPTIATCTATPTAPGCTAVLPPLADCTTNPTLPGCTAVLPTIATCSATPTAPGCAAVLPPLAGCTTNPALPGCTAVLPTIATCTATPTAPGCTAVLPTIDTCTANPTALGCTAVLPPLADCATNPTLPGCTAVLPTIATCSATPTAPGCTAVLPSLSTCITNPTAPGCTAVLPPALIKTPSAEVVATILAVVTVAPVIPTQTIGAGISTPTLPAASPSSDQQAASSTNRTSGNNKEEDRERKAQGVSVDKTSQDLPLARQPIFDLGGGGIAGQNMVCK